MSWGLAGPQCCQLGAMGLEAPGAEKLQGETQSSNVWL